MLVHALQIRAVDRHPQRLGKWIANDGHDHREREQHAQRECDVDVGQRESHDEAAHENHRSAGHHEIDRLRADPVSRLAFKMQPAPRTIGNDDGPPPKKFPGAASRTPAREAASEDFAAAQRFVAGCAARTRGGHS